MLFELDKYDRNLHRLPPASPTVRYEGASNIEKTSLLYWAEHCVECAAPSCYQSCDLYQPRTDIRCRRFTFGAFKNRNFTSARGYGVEIAFKKWAKMEAYGNLRLSEHGKILFLEKLLGWAAPAVNIFGKIAARLTNKIRWNALAHEGLEELVRRLHRNRPNVAPDAFLLEIYNPSNEVSRMQLKFSLVSGKDPEGKALLQLSRDVTSAIVCSPGYSRHEVDVAALRGVIGAGDPFIISLIPEADGDARLVFLTADFVKFAGQPESRQQKNVKCVVLDLDHTLWQGTLIEGDEVEVRPQVVELLKYLDERGILLSIASKNDHDSAWKKLEQLGLSDYFLYPQINWNPKSQSIKTIARRLNIGIDSIAFVDDSSFELDEVANACPEVACVNSNAIPSLAADPRFRGSSTPDARRRRLLYQDASARELAQESFGSDFAGFLDSCRIKLEICSYSEEHSERVAELVQRTNQLNFSGRKHTRQELEQFLSNPLLDKFVLKCSDRYGLYGTVGFCLADYAADTVRIQEFMLSCRVQGKLIEKAFFHHLMQHHNLGGATKLWVHFRPTARNQPSRQVLESLGFQPSEGQSDTFAQGVICESPESLRCDMIEVQCQACHDERMTPQLPGLTGAQFAPDCSQ